MGIITVKQIQEILECVSNLSSEEIEEVLRRGLVADFFTANPDDINRVVLRQVLGLKSIIQDISIYSMVLRASNTPRTEDCFQYNETIKHYCELSSEKQTGVVTNQQRLARRIRFNAVMPTFQTLSKSNNVYVCPINGAKKPDEGNANAFDFASYIVGKGGTLEEVSKLLIKNGHYMSLYEIEMFITHSFFERETYRLTDAGLMFFVINSSGNVSVLHLESFN